MDVLYMQVTYHEEICMKKPNANNEDKQINKYVCFLVKCGECVLFGGYAVAPEGRGVRFLMVSLEFFIDIILPAALLPWG